MTNREKFKSVYAVKLKESRTNYPNLYSWPIEDLSEVILRMFDAIDKKMFNKDNISLKATCEELKIKHTYKAIFEYLEKEGNQ
jgi:hypothetical protein